MQALATAMLLKFSGVDGTGCSVSCSHVLQLQSGDRNGLILNIWWAAILVVTSSILNLR